MRRLCVVLLALFVGHNVFAQELKWSGVFESLFDNREFGADNPLSNSQTIFGTRITPQIGVGWGNNAIMAGGNAIIEYGASPFELTPDLLLYYTYKDDRHVAYVGSIPRSAIMSDFNRSFISDSVRFYDNVIEGGLFQYVGDRGFIEAGVDWCGRCGYDMRERFLIFSGAQLNEGTVSVGYRLFMMHHAGSVNVRGVVDNVLVKPYVGVDFSKLIDIECLSLQVGYIQALQNDRLYVGEYVYPIGLDMNLKVEVKNIGVDNTLYVGDNLMPYYDRYNYSLYYGDPLYRTENGCYDRFELYWEPSIGENLALKISSIHHFDGVNWWSQQRIGFIIRLNRSLFR